MIPSYSSLIDPPTLMRALVIVGIVLAAFSGIPGAFLSRRSNMGERISTVSMVLSGAAGLVGAFGVVAVGQNPTSTSTSASTSTSLPWNVPGGELAIRIDTISAVFLAQIFLIAPLVSIYGVSYWSQANHPENGRKLRVFHGLLTASMGVLVIAKNSILFLAGWEVMALTAFLVVTTDDKDEHVQRSGLIYLIATRIGTLALFTMFAVLHHASQGTWNFAAPSGQTSPSVQNAIFLLAIFGCALKAGVMPMHVWLPGAHANAPSHVSAFMSGVLIKMGIYGLVRVCSFFDEPPRWWGVLVFGLGVVSGILGVAFAIAQHDLKRLLAYHSVENIGIILMGLGLALIGRSLQNQEIVALGLAAALLHVWNHGLFKALLFFSAGSVIHAAHTREIDALGGLARKMPKTTRGFLIGAIAICGLPPFNGFVSELLLYIGLGRAVLLETTTTTTTTATATATATSGGLWLVGAFGIPALALIGALALACFVKVFGAIFLGTPRSAHALGVQKESALTMTMPLFVLSACCVFIGIAPLSVVPMLDDAVLAWAPRLMATTTTTTSPSASIAAHAPLAWLSITGPALLAAIAIGVWLTQRTRSASASFSASTSTSSPVTWDCGYVAPTPRMQYTASSFGSSLVGLFGWALRPHVDGVTLRAPFPSNRAERLATHVPDTVLDRGVLPALRVIGRVFVWFRWVQQGNVHLYLLYIVVALLLTILFRR